MTRLLCVIFLAAVPVLGADAVPDGPIASAEPGWPQWRGPRRDGVSAEAGLLRTWPEGGPKLLWRAEGLGLGWSSPIVVGRRVFITGDVGDDLVIFAFDLQGKPAWKTANGKAWTGSYPGARATCAFSEGRLYLMTAHGRAVCLDAEDGKELWAVDVLDRFDGRNITWAMSECLLVDGRRLIVTPGGKKALMAALDKTTGQTLWTTEPLGEDRATYASPVLFHWNGRRLLANCSSAHGFGADATSGKLLWSVPLKNRFDVNVSSPVYGAGRVFYVTAYFPGGCFQLKPEADGVRADRAWETTLDTVTGGAVLADGTLYAAGYNKFKSWVGVDWASGETRCGLKDLTTGAAVFADGCLYCLAEDGRAALVTTGAEGLKLAGEIRLTPKKVRDAWAHPVVLDGRLYLRYHDTLWCYDARTAR